MRLRVRLAAAMLLALPLPAQTPARNGYVAPAACARCYAAIAERYARTGMGRSFRSTPVDAYLPEFDREPLLHVESGERFTPERRAGKHGIRRDAPGGAY